MNIICDRNILEEAVIAALTAVSNKNTNKALEGVLITADKDSGTFLVCGYDMEKGVKVTVSGEKVQINESGAIILNAEKFSSIVKNLPDGAVSLDSDAIFNVSITGGKSIFTLNGFDGGTFPAMPEFKGDRSFKLPCKQLKSMIASVLFSAAVNSSRPALNGVFFEIKNNGLNIVSSDGNRLSLRRSYEGITSSDESDASFIIPGKSLSELLRLLDNGDKPAEIELTPKHAVISFDNILFFSRLIENEFLDYRRIVQISPKTTVVIDKRSFLDSVERAAVLTDAKPKTIIRLNFSKKEVNIENKDNAGVLEITSESTAGKVCDECDVDIYGEDIIIGFNQRYLAEALKNIKDDKVLLKLESATKSLIILPYDGKSSDVEISISKFLYLILPVRLSNK